MRPRKIRGLVTLPYPYGMVVGEVSFRFDFLGRLQRRNRYVECVAGDPHSTCRLRRSRGHETAQAGKDWDAGKKKTNPGRTPYVPTGDRLDRRFGHFVFLTAAFFATGFFAAALQQRFAAGAALAAGAAFLQQHFLAAGLAADFAQHFFTEPLAFSLAFLTGAFFVVAIGLILLVERRPHSHPCHNRTSAHIILFLPAINQDTANMTASLVTCNLRCSIATSDAPMHHLTLQTDRHNSAISRRMSRFQARSPPSRLEKPVFMQSSAMRTQASVLDLQLQMDTLPRGPCHGFAIDALSRTLRPISRHHVRSGT